MFCISVFATMLWCFLVHYHFSEIHKFRYRRTFFPKAMPCAPVPNKQTRKSPALFSNRLCAVAYYYSSKHYKDIFDGGRKIHENFNLTQISVVLQYVYDFVVLVLWRTWFIVLSHWHIKAILFVTSQYWMHLWADTVLLCIPKGKIRPGFFALEIYKQYH